MLLIHKLEETFKSPNIFGLQAWIILQDIIAKKFFCRYNLVDNVFAC